MLNMYYNFVSVFWKLKQIKSNTYNYYSNGKELQNYKQQKTYSERPSFQSQIISTLIWS